MNPQIKDIKEKKLVGLSLKMSLTNYPIGNLWQGFRKRTIEITHKMSDDFISLAIYPANYFSNFNPSNEFERWACLEVSEFENIPPEMKKFILPAGLYAVFNFNGTHTVNSYFEYIFESWLPSSNYILDQRPHFEILGKNYKHNHPQSEEEIFIPIKLKLINHQ